VRKDWPGVRAELMPQGSPEFLDFRFTDGWLATLQLKSDEDALRIAERGLARYPDFPMFNVPAAAAAAQLGRKEQAARYVEVLHRPLPFLDLDSVGSRFNDPAHPAYLREGLKAAGL
jgi:hypothetical protein